jgi:hypothetical protein
MDLINYCTAKLAFLRHISKPYFFTAVDKPIKKIPSPNVKGL